MSVNSIFSDQFAAGQKKSPPLFDGSNLQLRGKAQNSGWQQEVERAQLGNWFKPFDAGSQPSTENAQPNSFRAPGKKATTVASPRLRLNFMPKANVISDLNAQSRKFEASRNDSMFREVITEDAWRHLPTGARSDVSVAYGAEAATSGLIAGQIPSGSRLHTKQTQLSDEDATILRVADEKPATTETSDSYPLGAGGKYSWPSDPMLATIGPVAAVHVDTSKGLVLACGSLVHMEAPKANGPVENAKGGVDHAALSHSSPFFRPVAQDISLRLLEPVLSTGYLSVNEEDDQHCLAKSTDSASVSRVEDAMSSLVTRAAPVRLHVQIQGQSATIWLGMDGSANQVASQVEIIVAELREHFSALGQRISQIVCNGSVVFDGQSKVVDRREKRFAQQVDMKASMRPMAHRNVNSDVSIFVSPTLRGEI